MGYLAVGYPCSTSLDSAKPLTDNSFYVICVVILSWYAKVISVDEAPCSGWTWLIIRVDIEQHGSKDATLREAIPLFPPSALFAIQLNIEASVFQK